MNKTLISEEIKEVIKHLDDVRNRINYYEKTSNGELDLIDNSIRSLREVRKEVEYLEKGYHIKLGVTLDETIEEVNNLNKTMQEAYNVASKKYAHIHVNNQIEIALKEIHLILEELNITKENFEKQVTNEHLFSILKKAINCINEILATTMISKYEDETIEKIKDIKKEINIKIKKLEVFMRYIETKEKGIE